MIVIRLLQAGVGMVPLALVWWTAGRRLDGWVGVLVDLAFWAYVVLRPLAVPVGWLTTTTTVDATGVRSATGLLARRETTVAWDEIVSVDVSQPSLHRLFGCYAVRFGIGTSQQPAVRIDAVRRERRDAIVAESRRARPHGAPPEAAGPVATSLSEGPTPEHPDREVYRIRTSDYLLVSVTYGQFVLFVPAVASLLDELGDWVRLPLPALGQVFDRPWPEQLALFVGVLVCSVAYGWVFAWLRFRGFHVVRDEAGWATSGGLLSSETRTVPARHVRGLKVVQNPLMRVLGFGRVSVLTADAGEQPMANLLFPVIRLTDLPAALGAELPVNPEVVTPTLRLDPVARVSLGLGGVLAAAALVAVAYAVHPGWLLASTSTVVLVVAFVVNAHWVVATTVPGRPRCYARRGLFWVSHVELDLTAVHVVESSQGLVGRLSRTWTVALHYHDGKVRHVRAPGCDAARQAALAAAVLP